MRHEEGFRAIAAEVFEIPSNDFGTGGLQPRDRNVGFELTTFGRETGRPRSAFMSTRELFQFRTSFDAGPNRSRLFSTERTEPGNAGMKSVHVDARKHIGELARGPIVDVADEPQRDVHVVGIDPASAGKRLLHIGEIVAKIFREFDTGKKTRHGCNPPLSYDNFYVVVFT
ncbi:protein of unknown function [Candidatus Filomicrobium marinum]|uniref:Uncharacterized protein n=1 Tax=Candidatus Filomicrobium marinum TaxID=1608628 RepID=A0A0D6JC92_9HYPH|nr:protein of unknown function [Candidatus Filomicrobium marinum]CPR17054.1 protein of unknown function [Candidatus Filomicrobium marinum]